jgi:hypothetical protein
MKRSIFIKKLQEELDRLYPTNRMPPAGALLKIVERLGLVPEHTYISSGCMHSLREGCSCQGSYKFGWERE